MDKSANPSSGGASGTLYLVATPIGNLEDMSYRAVRILKEADAVFCEDTRRTLQLLKHFGIERASGIDSFHDHSHRSVLQKIKKLLSEGRSVAYATDGGLPVVSDPGFVLVRAATECGAPVTVVPGPSAAGILFAASGLPSPKYFFHGFFPRTRGEVERTLELIRQNPVVHVFYEAPGRITGTFEILDRHFPAGEAVLGRELTKLHEELLRGTVEQIHEALVGREKVKGECALAILGGAENLGIAAPKAATEAQATAVTGEAGAEIAAGQPVELSAEQQAEISSLIKSGISSKDAAKELSKKYGVSRRVIYEFIIRRLT